ncbi:polysaccharide lyase family 1 protein [Desarmillaria ectypa]|nr:polysaccharide lyase family 1 protein [Desarmillaria ectypa]
MASLRSTTLNGGTTGGVGRTTTTVTALAVLTSAILGDNRAVTGSAVVKVGSNTSVLGVAGSLLDGVGLRVLDESNVIIRNVKIQKVLADVGDAVGIQASSQVWVDHVDLSSDRDHSKAAKFSYDGLLDITHGCYGIIVTNSKLYTHWKASLIGHFDRHIFNNVYDDNNDGINTRDGAELLVENNVWTGTEKPLYSTDEGYAVAIGNDCGGAENSTSPVLRFISVPTSYSLIATASVCATVEANTGQTLTF